MQDGRRHNDGYYQVSDWGPLDHQWVEVNTKKLESQFNG
ncbi:hypothetical protein JCM19232_6340 [Vibrio ishigakensis]|uniref:Uncharacterized protein n=1 Tax=Vibrio ishigakensis TaxID=1481914 RepID=A0A0B8P5E0_9VIBR|nr:hypothetical protein JCM19232_6340 [Vibrio ishigakensis]